MGAEKKRVLMICLGNICRSPMAEAVFQNSIKERGLQDKWEVDSAALIGYHTGKSPDHRTMSTLEKNNLTDYKHRARTVKKSDFETFDWIFGMDDDNIEHLKDMRPKDDTGAKIELLGKYDPAEELIIRDPYYDHDISGFEKVYEQCVRSISAFLDQNN